jgi:hypothetical protein
MRDCKRLQRRIERLKDGDIKKRQLAFGVTDKTTGLQMRFLAAFNCKNRCTVLKQRGTGVKPHPLNLVSLASIQSRGNRISEQMWIWWVSLCSTNRTQPGCGVT